MYQTANTAARLHRQEPTISQSQPEVGENIATSIAVCRAVFDDLMERDLLGFLLSTTHLQKYLAHFTTYAHPNFASLVSRNIMNVEVVASFHKHMLKMYSGIYIQEAKIATHSELFTVLDAKYKKFADDNDSGDVKYEASLKQLECVELAWKYRHACGKGSAKNTF